MAGPGPCRRDACAGLHAGAERPHPPQRGLPDAGVKNAPPPSVSVAAAAAAGRRSVARRQPLLRKRAECKTTG